jgi:hypothetical protein
VDIGEKEIIEIAVSDNNAVDSLPHSTEITENIMVQTLGDVVRPVFALIATYLLTYFGLSI